jgi:hypothetical protein
MDMLELRDGRMLPIRRIEMPAFAPEYERTGNVELDDGFATEMYNRIQELRPALLEAIHQAVVAHLEKCGLHERDSFPCRECLTGEYYLSTNETYYFPGYRIPGPTPAIFMKVRCLGWLDPWSKGDKGWAKDYLGISVVTEFDPEQETFKASTIGHEVIGNR